MASKLLHKWFRRFDMKKEFDAFCDRCGDGFDGYEHDGMKEYNYCPTCHKERQAILAKDPGAEARAMRILGGEEVPMLKLKVTPQVALAILQRIKHETFEAALPQYWKVDKDGYVAAQSAAWLWCWAETGMGSDKTALEVTQAWAAIMPISSGDYEQQFSQEELRKIRYQFRKTPIIDFSAKLKEVQKTKEFEKVLADMRQAIDRCDPNDMEAKREIERGLLRFELLKMVLERGFAPEDFLVVPSVE
jgi:hypothetical protein